MLAYIDVKQTNKQTVIYVKKADNGMTGIMSENFSLRKVFLAYILIWWNFLMRIYKITSNLPNRRTKNDLLLS